MKTPLTKADLHRIIALVPDEPVDLIRQDKNFKELELDASNYTDETSVVELLMANPKLMQRPIVVRGERAVIARPSDKVLALLD